MWPSKVEGPQKLTMALKRAKPRLSDLYGFGLALISHFIKLCMFVSLLNLLWLLHFERLAIVGFDNGKALKISLQHLQCCQIFVDCYLY